MNCAQHQWYLAASPNSVGASTLRHIIQCPACRQHRRHYQAFDATLLKAMRIPVDPTLVARWHMNAGTVAH